jgi:cytochrome bd-type quinol oxidase subunit 2
VSPDKTQPPRPKAGLHNRHRSTRLAFLWAAANLLFAIAAAGWIALGLGLRSECEGGDCDDWLTADAIALGVTMTALLIWAASRRRRSAWLALASGAMLVPVVHVIAGG